MSEPALFGRDTPLSALRDALDDAHSGRGRFVLISGEAGIGKSALTTAFARQAEARRTVVTWGRAWEFADAPPYFPVWPCLRSLGIDVAGADGLQQQGETNAFRLWEDVLSSLARATAGEPAVWIVEDIHAADLGTLDLLTFLVQPLRAMRALVVATTRQHDPRLTDRELRRLGRMTRDGLEIRLDPLAERDVASIAEQTTGHAPSAPALQRLVELTGGNPLFVVECARASIRAGAFDGTSLPPTVRQVVLDRALLLPDAARDALSSGAVVGREFAAGTVAAMHDSDPVRVLDTLLPAVRAGILRETKPGCLAFSHALVRDAIYGAISEAERVRLHGRAEIALAALGEAPDVLVERARHAVAAAARGEPQRVLAIAHRATELLEAEGAFDRALSVHLRVHEARDARFLPPASNTDKLHVARVAREAGRAAVARSLCEEIVSSARASGDADVFARAVLFHAADVRIGVIDPRQIALLEEALRLLADRAPTLTCRVLARLSTALQPADDPSEPLQMARDALRRARATGDETAVLDVLDLAAFGAYHAPAADRIAWSEEMRDRALAANDSAKALTAWTTLAFWHADIGDFAAFDRDVTNALELSAAIGHPRFRWSPLLLAAGRSLMLGRFDEADAFAAEVGQDAGLVDHPALPLSLVAHEVARAKQLRLRDDLRVALAKLDGVTEGIKRKQEFVAVTRAACMARLEDAEATSRELARVDLDCLLREPEALPLVCFGEALAIAGSDDDRRRMRSHLLALHTDEAYDAGISFTYEGTVRRVIGLLDAALGDLPAAAGRLREALEGARARGHAPWIAQLARELAKVLQRIGREADARALMQEHVALARDLGIALLGPEELAAVDRAVAREAPDSGLLRVERTGDVWTIERAGRTARVKDSRGMQLLARLVERPGEEIHVLALASDQGASAPESTAGEMLDDRARAAYRRRLAELDEALEAAEATSDVAAARRLDRERKALVAELSRATGLGGRARQAGSATERARVNVQRRLKGAIQQMAEVDPELGRFFEHTVRTGTYCCFRP